MNSIRGRLTITLIATILPLIAVSDAFLYVYFANSLRGEFDRNLSAKALAFSRMAEWEDEIDAEEDEDEAYDDLGDDPENLLHFEFAELALPEFESAADSGYYEVTGGDGRVYARSPSLHEANSELPAAASSSAAADLVLPDGRRGRMVALRFVPVADDPESIPADAPTDFVIALALSAEGLAGTLATLRLAMVVGAAITIAAAGLLLWVGSRRGLKPLEDLADLLRRTNTDTLSEAIRPAGQPAELLPIYARLNEMLERMGMALERERRFTSDVAHELRTPIAELRALAEVCGSRPGLSEADRTGFSDALEVAIHMERLVTSLLEIARWSSGELGKDLKRADLTRLIDAAWEPLMESARRKDLRVRLGIEGPVEIETDPVIFGIILSNLLSNAVSYTPQGGDISLECGRTPGALAITLSNTTDDLTPQDVPRLFEKFWRKDCSRTSQGHFGLGLPLVAALARAMGISVEGHVRAGGVFQISIVHPC